MIRLVASDMDGTLFDRPNHVPEETFGLIRELRQLGVRFTTVSGRRHEGLLDAFAPVADEMDFVCCNGAEVYSDGRCILRETMPHNEMLRMAEAINRFDCLHLFVRGIERDVTFLLDPTEEKASHIVDELGVSGGEVVVREAPTAEDHCYWACVICDLPSETSDLAYALRCECGNSFKFPVFTEFGFDVVARGVSKDRGLATLMRHHGIARDEVVAYGDSMNDYDVLRFVGHPVVMGNARHAVREIAERTIETNLEHGVQRDLRRLVDELAGRRGRA